MKILFPTTRVNSKKSSRFFPPKRTHLLTTKEHIHKDEETRFFIEGSGYFDVRGLEDEWIRIHAFAGDLIILPPGLYHRYSQDEKNYSKVLRLSCGKPVWTAYNRSATTDKLPERVKYVKICQLLADEPPSEEDDYDSGSSESASDEDDQPESSSSEEERGVKRKADVPSGNQAKKAKK